MQREHVRRGFSISHQKVVLEVDFSGSIWGYTEITVVPTNKDLKTLHLHSRQCTIHSVTVASHPADFTYHDPLASLNVSNPQDVHLHPELKRKVYSALAEGEEGELSIAIPNEVSLRQSGHAAAGLVSEAATPEPQTPGLNAQATLPVPEFVPININIIYSMRNPADGIQFVIPTDAYPYRVPHVYTTPSSPDAARCWVPCVDNLWEKCTWDFEFVVPRYLEQRESAPEDDGELLEGDNPTIVVCSGELVEQVAHPYNSSKTIFVFSQNTSTSVQHIAFAAGPFHVHSIPADLSAAEDVSGTSQPLMHAFCLPGHESLLGTSVSFMRSAMSFYSTEFGSYPFGSHKLVFVDEMPTQRFDSATLSLVTVDLLHGEDAIDQVLETRHCLSHALACQWIGINIQQKTWSDTWLTNGLGLYIAGLFIRKLMGNNEYRFRLKKDMERVLELDNGSMPPVCQPQLLEPPDLVTLSFINLKSPLVLHILDRRLGKSGTSLGLSRVLPKVFLSAISGELPNNALSTHSFLRTCRKVSGIDPRSFAEQWIYGSGCPTFGFSATFNRKKMAVEISMRQEAPAFKVHENNEVTKVLMKPVPFFEGQMTIRIHEADGTPYEHVLDIRSSFKRYEVPFNTKYKRVRRNTKRYLARQAAAQAAAEGDAEAAAAMNMVDMGFGLEIWENERERENWKVADWTEEDEQNMAGQTYEWIRIDADFEWIAAIAFDQKDYMWVSQLQRDRDVVAQYEAIQVLSKTPNAIISSTLAKTVLVSNYYFRIRCEAAQALVTCAMRRMDWLGLFHLFKLFLRYCYEPEDPNPDLFSHTYVPRPNDFSDFAEYFVRKSLIRAISKVRFENGKTPPIIRQFLIDQLRYNDNTSNPYSDAFYICTIIAALACATISTVPPERGEFIATDTHPVQDPTDIKLLEQALTEVDRYRSMDRLIPTYHNVVTVAVVEFHLMLSVANLIPHDPRLFFPLTREGNYSQVRMAAFDYLFLSKWYTPKVMRYILAVMAHDSSRVVRRHVAQNACLSLALLVTMGEMKTLKETESLLIEEDGTNAEKAKESKKSDMDLMIKAFRKDRELGKSEVIREYLMPIALAPETDHEVRWGLLKLADLLIRGAEEAPPKVMIHLPPTPVSEVAPVLPAVKLPPKARPSFKSGGPPTKAIAPPFTPRLKFMSNNSQVDVSARMPGAVTPNVSRRDVFPVPRPPAPKRISIVEKKDKSIPKARSGGMSLNDVQACRNALKKLQMHKNAHWFLQPVDPVRDNAPNYFDIIKKPMDLSTMSAKLEQGKYRDRFAFEEDFRLVISNAKLYNLPGSFVHNEALGLESFFDKQWVRINKTLEAADRAMQSRAVHQPPLPTKAPSVVSLVSAPVASSSNPVAPLSSRPSVKLKVVSAAAERQTTPKPAPKLKVKKVHELKPPAERQSSPAFIDDGSADLLEEVIAIEREKDEEQRRNRASTSIEKEREKEKQIPKVMVGKRKKPAEETPGDDLLALTSMPKKDRSIPPPSVGVTPTKAAAVPQKNDTSASAQKNSAVQPKSKEKGVRPVENPAPTPEAGISQRPSTTKGKEKEVPPPINAASMPSKAKRSPPQGISINEKKCRDVLKTLMKLPNAAIFLRPVDPVLDGCPTYYDEIKEPMDFSTISNKLNEGAYATMEDFAQDIELILHNCRTFNPSTTYPTLCADEVERVFKKEWGRALEKKLTGREKRSLQGIMTKLSSDPQHYVFWEPVDPIALGIPTYFDRIPRKDARDLRTIREKLDADKYDSVAAWEADMNLMANNAIKFNGATSEVGQMATAIRRRYQEMVTPLKSSPATSTSTTPTATKRKGNERETSQSFKKARIG
ncbi:uncharacterized protein LAESUDRAFT_45791 [Laetiporus sulphureus 93-53]|uniref:Transcription initiation factor TFIID subunit 2 n=1 Tax=Laetiporus sulphureus 93-53 TaxID=1314785 RepID=A0A165F9E4_9APHY|nr:uncharacterized protein LAESUDRAFT_45791 [Laetiporus sulphureus 93-53]KZT08630.1 hypothetical protein LAESUDRAFT_45791 [Laetiporus sulphureus 93-53]